MTKQTIDIKIHLNNSGGGRIKFKLLGLKKQYISKTMPASTIKAFRKDVVHDLERLSMVDPDPITRTTTYPFTETQIAWIEKTGPMHPVIRDLFTLNRTFRELFMEHIKPSEQRRFSEYRINQIPWWNTRITAIQTAEVVKVLAEIKDDWRILSHVGRGANLKITGESDKKLSPRTMAQFQKIIKRVFLYAYNCQYIDFNVCNAEHPMIKRTNVPNGRAGKKHYWLPRICEVMYKAAAMMDIEWKAKSETGGQGSGRIVWWDIELFIRLGIFTGARWTDLMNASWSDFDFINTDDMTWKFIQTKHASKTGYDEDNDDCEFYVTIDDFGDDPVLLEMLQAKRKGSNSPYVFEGGTENTVRHRFAEVIKIADKIVKTNAKHFAKYKIKEVVGSPHKMRHTMVSNVVTFTEGQWDVAAVRAGHRNSIVTKLIYGNMMTEWIDKAIAEKNVKLNKAKAAAQADLAEVDFDLA